MDRPIFLQAILEGLVDGIAIFSDRGELIHANKKARTLCQQLPPNPAHPYGIPQAILQICHALIEGHQLWGDRILAIESEVNASPSNTLRLRGRWVQWEANEPAYVSITLEDSCHPLQKPEIDDSEKYGLTPRETEVWSLRCAHYSYKEIGAKLYISENTVKKHLKNIRVKQKAFFGKKNHDSED
ncbi:helix-turn-helix transcriptional regulator [Oscillatoria sp. FACHB-1406]|uniref:helix-turn-helix transcriptional regulator n=1 Tax=Oscillatoria sp. FACHB-1406 TaxID=2692846 RepID=UPI001689EC37|nr:helix-turn-helix transcriptional regulator [Oscillatoria sp. FACHB-1406]MBD2579417.1 helix-turn-helix transcriptional regulator [Oscillatoria sp. FACHB-1406]